MTEQTLAPVKLYLQTGAHIGTKFKSGSMKRFVFKVRQDKLRVIDVELIDSRLKIAADFISRFKPEDVIIASRKQYAKKALKLFSKITKSKAVIGRFVPGTLTNTNAKTFIEGKVIIIIDQTIDKQAILEAGKLRIPVVALCSTDNSLKDIDLAIPINNNGRQSIALAVMVMAQEILKERKEIASEQDFKYTLKDFEYPLEEAQKEEMPSKTFKKERKRRR